MLLHNARRHGRSSNRRTLNQGEKCGFDGYDDDTLVGGDWLCALLRRTSYVRAECRFTRALLLITSMSGHVDKCLYR
jgi:hypothetical protein